MAYFLPSYFQKRLLRYALSRLDFLDDDALDLNNLAFTIGQRSVIELKNVGVKVSKVVERLNLPPSIVPRHASIRLVRITIPADLHVSGIEVEIDGVDLQVDLDPARLQEPGKHTGTRAAVAPSHKDVANQPRLASGNIHDPGGSHIIPSSQDLAASFLQAEPEREKRELQAVVESRSTYIQSSSTSLENSISEAGYGMPEGFSLPGFVATFFSGIADRLAVDIRHIDISISTFIENDRSSREPLEFILKVAGVKLQSLRNVLDSAQDLDLRRSVHISGIEFLISSEADLFSQKSTVSSPRLSKGKSPTSVFSRQDSLSSVGAHNNPSRPADDLNSSTSSANSAQRVPFDLDPEDSMLKSSRLFDPSLARSKSASSEGSPEFSRLSLNEQGSRRDRVSAAKPLSSSDMSDNSPSDVEELAESRFFSHEDAESMYMSALSDPPLASQRLPEVPETSAYEPMEDRRKNRTTSENTLKPLQESLGLADEPPARIDEEEPADVSTSEGKPTFTSILPQSLSQCSKCILRINEIDLKIPLKSQADSDLEESHLGMPSRGRQGVASSRVPYSDGRILSSHARTISDHSTYGIPLDHKVQLEDCLAYEVSVGDIDIAFDINICHVLLKSTTKLTQISTTSNRTPDSRPKNSPDMHLKASVHSIAVSLMESVPEYMASSKQKVPTESTFSVRGDESPLLQLQVLKLQANAVWQDGKNDRKLTVHRFTLYREAEKVLSFFDPMALQESFVASSVIIEKDDIVIRQLDNRVDISTKPLRIALDLVVLDDVLSRSGGLSSLLELGNSATLAKNPHPQGTSTQNHRRSVRFNDSVTPPATLQQDDASIKLDMRISGALVDLIGSQSSLQVKTSSIKLAYRSAKFRTNVSSISIRGPIVKTLPSNELVNLRFNDVQLVYLNTPEEEDLDRLLELLAPSSEKLEQNDDIMVDTLLRQRRKGGVMRLTVQEIHFSAQGLAWIRRLTQLSEEISKLSTVTKYLPEDDRPGILTFALVNKLIIRLEIDPNFGPLLLRANLMEGAHISVPSLMAAQISSFNLSRGNNDALFRQLIPNMQESLLMGPPMLMCRFIPDEMEPTVKLKLSNTCFEYSVPMLLAVTQLAENVQKSLFEERQPLSPRASDLSASSSEVSELSRKVKVSLTLQTSAISLQPINSPAKALFVLTDAIVGHSAKRDAISATLEIKKASIMIIDDAAKIGYGTSGADPKLYFDQNDQIQELVKSGFVPVGSLSAALADIEIIEDKVSNKQFVDVEFRNSLLFLETCADSTQTLIQILGALSPPSVPSKVAKYRTEIIPLSDMLASFTGNAFVSEKGPELGLRVEEEAESTPTPSTILTQPGRDYNEISNSDEDDETFMNDLHLSRAEDDLPDQMTESSIMSGSSMPGSIHVGPVNITADDESSMSKSIVMHSMLDLRDGHFTHKTSVGGTAHRWDSSRNTYGLGSEAGVQQSPLKVRVRDVHIIWNLFDGYDWQNTRDVITQAVRDVEDKALAKQRRRDSRRSPGLEEEDESVIGDVLFNSIYISIPTNRDPRELTNAINMDLGDAASETGSYATSTTVTATTSKRHSGTRYRQKRLKLNRSKHHKMTFELEGLAADFLMFPPGSGEVESSVDIRIRNIDIFDHVPTSTWKKFATYMHEAGEREVGTDMVHIEILNVKPVAELAASEIVMKLTVLPLRLHVDQDALDFLTRFFEFKDDRTPPSTTPSAPPFLQRAEVNPIRLRLDFKPKRVDYAGLKSGRTTEFMNFFILDRADMVLRRVILYGVSGFDRLGIMLNNIWTPDVRNNQLPGVLAGLAPVRSLVDVGSGVRDLVAVPIREYKKDGRIVRSIQKGAIAFAKTTTTELVNLGAKLAIGTQTVLQNAEGVLAPQKPQSGFTSDEDDDENQKQISHYADQPLGIVQGLRGAYASLERDLLLAKDAIVAVPGEIMADGSATGAAKVVLKQSPIIILRPAIGVTKAMGQALLGAGNTLDKGNRKRIEDKYKRY